MNDLTIEHRMDPRDLIAAVHRRRKPLLLTAAILFAIAAIVAWVLPPIYRSEATILIEEQEMPQDLVRTTVTSYADQRIQLISQQVMTRAHLMEIVAKYDLYPESRKSRTSEEILERMRKDIKLDLVTADVRDRRSGGKVTATIAFTLSYDSPSPDKAQKVANELTTLFLNQNLQIRQQKAQETSDFLGDEAGRLNAHIAETEDKLAKFKAANAGRLPELANLNLQMRDRAEAELADVDRQMVAIGERRFYLESQLAQVKPNTPIIGSGGERILDPEERLKSLKAQFAGMGGIYSPDHPDMVRMRKQIAALEREVGGGVDTAENGKQLVRLRGDLAVLRDRYAEDHPDVASLKGRIAALEASRTEDPGAAAPARKPENPVFISLQTQQETVRLEAKSLEQRRDELRRRLADLEARIFQSPGVEKDYMDLTRDREGAMARYRDIRVKQMEADVAQDLEKDRKSERFSLIDPAQFPEKPRSPNRPAILLIGVVLALGGGFGSVGVLETLDSSVRNSRDLARILAVPMLSVIPYIENAADRVRGERPKRWLLPAIVVTGILAVVAVHFLLMPLDVFAFAVFRKLGF